MKPCRECEHVVSEEALACPNCGAPYPAMDAWDGYGFEYKSRMNIMGLPLVHVSFKYRPNRMPVVARGVIAIGQFACGGLCIAQFGVGLLCISQFALGVIALAQIGMAYSLIAQIGLYIGSGYGQIVHRVSTLL